MMFKRTVSFLFAVIVATSSVFAWDAYSFTGVYDVASSAPVLYVDSSASSSSSLSGQDFTSNLVPYHSKIYSIVSVYHEPFDIPDIPGTGGGVSIPEWTEERPTPSDGVNATYTVYDEQTSVLVGSTVDFTSNLNDGEYQGIIGAGNYLEEVTLHSYNLYLVSDLDISSLGEFYTFSLSGAMRVYFDVYPLEKTPIDALSLDLIVNDSVVNTYFPGTDKFIQFNDFLYTSTVPITSVRFRWQIGYGSYPETLISGNPRFVYYFRNCSFDVLTGSPVLDGFVDDAQNDINDHESMESQWTGSMSSNFDALDMDSFAFPSGLLSGFSLITGIFQDLWNGMGDYKILYVFPLFLGIALLLIGRISKFSGGQSSSRSNRGDDDA